MSSANFKLKRTAAASRGFLATARFSCSFSSYEPVRDRRTDRRTGKTRNAACRMAAYNKSDQEFFGSALSFIIFSALTIPPAFTLCTTKTIIRLQKHLASWQFHLKEITHWNTKPIAAQSKCCNCHKNCIWCFEIFYRSATKYWNSSSL